MFARRPHNEYAYSRHKLHIATYKDKVQRALQIASAVISLTTIICIVCYHGFYISLGVKNFIRVFIHASLGFYVLKYFVFLFYSLHRKEFLKKSWIEGCIIFLLIVQFLTVFVFHLDLKIFSARNFENYYLLFIQVYFLIIVSVELTKASGAIGRLNISPPLLMVASFLLLIIFGTVLLSMPRMTVNGISFTDALFTATSASCITGLSTVSTGTCFTVKGQIVIMILIQLGGISILSFATFFTTFLSRSSVGLRYQYMVRDMLSVNVLSESVPMLRSIILTTAVIEFSGVALLYTYWTTTGFFETNSQNLFYSLFYTVSAFNNGGFALTDRSLLELGVTDNSFPQVIIAILVFLGGIGFLTIRDFFSVRNIRERHIHRWKSLMPQTKIVLVTTAVIILAGTLLFLFIEKDGALAGKRTFFDKFFASLLQIVTCRTSGFMVFDLNGFKVSTLLMITLIIFIGGSPGSTAGGVKTTTIFVLAKSVLTTIQGKKNIEYRHRTIPYSLVDRAFSIIIMSLSFIFVSCFFITLAEPDASLGNVIFETTSAFTTCGLSSGCISGWGTAAKLILVVNMYIGRIGTLTLAFALTRHKKESKHQYPDIENLMVG